MPHLQLRLLGGFEAEVDGVAIPATAWRRRRATDLIKLIALAPGHALAREQVMEALWPEADPELSANNLHRALYDLRQVLGGRFVHPDKGVIRLEAATVDAAELIARCEASDPASLTAALALYRGELCPDDPYTEHLEGRRQALRARAADAGVRLARHHLADGDAPGAVTALRRVLEIAPEHDRAQQLLVEAMAPTARGASEVARAVRRLIGTSAPPPMRGRGEALEALAGFIAGPGGALVITGEAGVGKTRLAVEGARLAGSRGARVLSGAALEVHASAAYGLFIEMWRDRARADGRPSDDHPFAAWPDPARPPLPLFLAVERSLDALAGDRPVALVIDDLHLADAPSLALLHHLARASRGRALHLICTCRDPGSPALHRLLAQLHRDRLVTRLALDRLDAAATLAQLTDLLGAPRAHRVAAEIFARGRGNPLSTEELAASPGHALRAAG